MFNSILNLFKKCEYFNHTDKLLHLFLGGWMTSIGLTFGPLGGVIAFIIMFVLSIVKEFVLDKQADWKDINAAIIGAIIATILYLPVVMFIP